MHKRNRYGVRNPIIKSQEAQGSGLSSCCQREEWNLKLNSQNSLSFDGILGSLYLNCTKIEVKGFIHSTAGRWRGSEIVSGAEWLGAIILEGNGQRPREGTRSYGAGKARRVECSQEAREGGS